MRTFFGYNLPLEYRQLAGFTEAERYELASRAYADFMEHEAAPAGLTADHTDEITERLAIQTGLDFSIVATIALSHSVEWP